MGGSLVSIVVVVTVLLTMQTNAILKFQSNKSKLLSELVTSSEDCRHRIRNPKLLRFLVREELYCNNSEN